MGNWHCFCTYNKKHRYQLMGKCKIISAKRIGDGAPALKLATPLLTLTVLGTTEIRASWNTVPHADYIILQWSAFADFSVILGTQNISYPTTQHDVDGLSENTIYYFRIKAVGAGYTDSDWGYANATTNSAIVMDNFYISVSDTQDGMDEAEILSGQAVPYVVGSTSIEMDLSALSSVPAIYRVAVRKNIDEMKKWEENKVTGNVGIISNDDVWFLRGEVASTTGPDWRLYYTTDPLGTLFQPPQTKMIFSV